MAWAFQSFLHRLSAGVLAAQKRRILVAQLDDERHQTALSVFGWCGRRVIFRGTVGQPEGVNVTGRFGRQNVVREKAPADQRTYITEFSAVLRSERHLGLCDAV